jgi:hypothetical protein
LIAVPLDYLAMRLGRRMYDHRDSIVSFRNHVGVAEGHFDITGDLLASSLSPSGRLGEIFLLHDVGQDFVFGAEFANRVAGLIRSLRRYSGNLCAGPLDLRAGGDTTSTAVTPGDLDASTVSTFVTRAWACGHVSNAACNNRGGLTSNGNLARPVSFATASTRVARVPITRRFSTDGQL